MNNNKENNKPKLLTSQEAADYICVAPDTLSVWRCTGRYSIPYIKIGSKVRYREQSLDEFLEKRTQKRAEVE
jgi:excisionase family DNA binding protein